MNFGRGIRKVGRFLARDYDDFTDVEVSEVDGVRALHLGSTTVQSAMRVSAPFELELSYSRGAMGFLLFCDDVRHAVVIGLGGGSIPKYIHRFLPGMRVTAIEINPQVVAAARQYFHLPDNDERLQVEIGDGAAYVREHPGEADILVLDAYDGKGLASDLSSQAFYDHCYDALSDNGILVVNLWGSDKYFDIYLQRIERSFGARVLTLTTGRPGNVLVFAFRNLPLDLNCNSLRARALSLQATHRIEFLEFVERLRDNNQNVLYQLIN
jgi:spermidine synthase